MRTDNGRPMRSESGINVLKRGWKVTLCILAATLLGPTGMAVACPGDGGPAPAEIKNHFCGTWNAAEARGLNPGTPLNNAFRFGGGWWRDFDGGAFGRGAIVEGDGVGFAYVVGRPWFTPYTGLGGPNSPLGYPVGRAEFGGHINNGARENRYMTFQGGVMNSWAAGTFATWGAILTKWDQLGDVSGPVGRPLSNEQQTARVNGRYSSFEGGNIIYNPRVNVASLVYGGILNKYRDLGFSDHPLGLPTGDRQYNSFKGNEYQVFDGGVINQYGGRAFETHGALHAKWQALGGANGPVGLPTSDEQQTARVDGRYATFEGGNLIYNPGTGQTWHVYGGILNKYAQLGYSNHALGLPTSDRQRNAAKGNDYQTFQGGVINQYGGSAYATHGAILGKWQALGGPDGSVGLPTSDEQQTARVNGRYATFEGGNLIYDPSTGQTWHVYGGVLNKYAQLGYSNHALGLPTSDRRRGPVGNDYQTFQGGVINQYGGNAFETHGGILARWERSGGPSGSLGLPTSDEQATARSPQGTTGRYARFQRGLINYNPKVDQAVVLAGAILSKYDSIGYASSYLGLPTSEEFNHDGGKRQSFEGGFIQWKPGWPSARTNRELDGGGTGGGSGGGTGGGSGGGTGGGTGGGSGGGTGGETGGGRPIPPPDRPGFKLRAIGDSVTAAFGFRPTGEPIEKPASALCIVDSDKPSCSSPEVVAWPAQFARRYPSIDFRSRAVSGATPADWIEQGGKYQHLLRDTLTEKPDLTVLTLGANPILRSFVAGRGNLCANTDLSGVATFQCIDRQLQENQVVDRLARLYKRLLGPGQNHVIVSYYHYTEPHTARPERIRYLLTSLNAAIASAYGRTVRDLPSARGRIRLINPRGFEGHGCISAQPWVIKIDTCIHPNRLGHEQFANELERVFRDINIPSARLQGRSAPVSVTASRAISTTRVSESATVVGQLVLQPASRISRRRGRLSARIVSTAIAATPGSGTVRLRYRLAPRHRRLLRLGLRRNHRVMESLTVSDRGGNVRHLQRRVKIKR